MPPQVKPSGFLVDDRISIADLHTYVILNFIGMGLLEGVPKEVVLAFPKLTNLLRIINEIPAVKLWNETNNADKMDWLK